MQNKFAWVSTPDELWEDKKEMITTALESGISHVLDLIDCENNIYDFQGAYTEELHYDQDHDIDGQFFQRAYFCFNKNNTFP